MFVMSPHDDVAGAGALGKPLDVLRHRRIAIEPFFTLLGDARGVNDLVRCAA